MFQFMFKGSKCDRHNALCEVDLPNSAWWNGDVAITLFVAAVARAILADGDASIPGSYFAKAGWNDTPAMPLTLSGCAPKNCGAQMSKSSPRSARHTRTMTKTARGRPKKSACFWQKFSRRFGIDRKGSLALPSPSMLVTRWRA